MITFSFIISLNKAYIEEGVFLWEIICLMNDLEGLRKP